MPIFAFFGIMIALIITAVFGFIRFIIMMIGFLVLGTFELFGTLFDGRHRHWWGVLAGLAVFAMIVGMGISAARADPYQPLDHGVALALDRIPAGGRAVIYKNGGIWATVTVVTGQSTGDQCKQYRHSLFPGLWRACHSGSWTLYEGSLQYARITIDTTNLGRCLGIGYYVLNPPIAHVSPARACLEGYNTYHVFLPN